MSQARDGAKIVASSNPIEDDDNDPPCIGAKRVYEVIVANAAGSFECVGELEDSPEVMEFEVGEHGSQLMTVPMGGPTVPGSGMIGRQPLSHG